MDRTNQPWLSDPKREMLWIIAPAFLPVLMVLLFQEYFMRTEVTTFWWVVLIMFVDVSHVYSTLFRLYWDKQTFHSYKRLLIIIPVVAFIVGFIIHYHHSLLFWRLLAYVAVFHFVRQQYGFMRLYSRKDLQNRIYRAIDAVAIYSATLYPLIYWHARATNQLTWFVKGDFIRFEIESLYPFTVAYIVIIVVYILKELRNAISTRTINVPKNLIVLGTYLSWYVGIVLFQGDLIFTLLNVVAHGIPYMALIWIYGERKAATTFSFGWKGVGIFAVVLLILAYGEEFFWDGLVWKDHPEVFPVALPQLENPLLISVIVSILVLPQVTHYILDGFIWRFSKDTRARI